MEKKQFVRGLLLRLIPFVLVLALTLTVKFANLAPDGWWGWYAIYALIFASIAFFVFFAVRHGKNFVVESVKQKVMKKSAEDFLNGWEAETYNREGVVDYIYQSERDFDRTITFREEEVEVRQILRDADGEVTGDADLTVYKYADIKGLKAVDIGGIGSPHIQLDFGSSTEYGYLDVDLARFLMEKTSLEIEDIDRLKEYYQSLIDG